MTKIKMLFKLHMDQTKMKVPTFGKVMRCPTMIVAFENIKIVDSFAYDNVISTLMGTKIMNFLFKMDVLRV